VSLPLEDLDVDTAVSAWPPPAAVEATITESLGIGELAEKARVETAAKAVTPGTLRARLGRLREVWPAIRDRLRRHLPPSGRLRDMLAAAGAPTEPEQIGITRERLRLSFRQAYLIRRRFTALDLAAEAGVLDRCLDRLFSRDGPWPTNGGTNPE